MNWGLAMTDHSKNRTAGGAEDEAFDLDLFFDAARQAPERPDAALFAAVLQDAAEVQADIARARAPQSGAQGANGRGLWAQFAAAIGGWPAVAGLASVATAGLWLGAVQPVGLSQTASGILGGAGLYSAAEDSYLVDVMPGYDFDLEEG